MTDPSGLAAGWRPLTAPPSDRRRDGFARLAVTHALGMSGEALLAVGLAGSLFFSVDPAEGRERVFLGLLLAVAPFAIVGPFIGPLIDRVRGGHRAVIIATMVSRAFVAAAMFRSAADGSLLLFPEAFVMLVLAKTYQVAKAAVVPGVVRGDTALVEANSKLQLIAGISGAVAAGPGLLFALAGPQWALALCSLVFVGAAFAARLVPRSRPTDPDSSAVERAELRGAEVVMAASSMAVVRGVVGFSTLLLAFTIRGGTPQTAGERMARRVLGAVDLSGVKVLAPRNEFPKWWFGLVITAGIAGGLLGASLAPQLRRRISERAILLGALCLLGVGGAIAVIEGGLVGMTLMALTIAAAASTAKQAFDAIVQQGAPDADLGRTFARFEARFQLVWVICALAPTAVHVPFVLGGLVVLVTAAVAVVSYTVGGLGIVAALRRSRLGQLSRSGKSGTSTSAAGSD